MSTLADYQPLGPVKIKFTPKSGTMVEINETLADQDTNFTMSIETYKVMVDQLAGAFMAMHVAGDDPATFTCSTLLKAGDLPNLSSAFVKHKQTDAVGMQLIGAPVIYGKLEIHPLSVADSSKAKDIIGAKVMCTPQIQGNFKTRDTVRVDLLFTFSADDDSSSPTYQKVFTLGEWVAETS